jgi:hypothetical protein
MDMTLDRYYYTPDVERAQIVLTTETSAGVSFRIEIDGQAGAVEPVPLVEGQQEYAVSVDISGWQPGRHVISGRLVDGEDHILDSIDHVLFLKSIEPAQSPPRPKEVGLRSDGILLVNGNPLCLFFASTGQEAPPFARDSFNMAYRTDSCVPDPLQRPSVTISKLVREEGEARFLIPAEEDWPAMVCPGVEARKAEDSFIYWFLQYEANYPLYREEGRVRLDNPQEWRKLHRLVKSIDSRHLTVVQIEGTPYAPYRDSADIIEISCPSSYAPQLIPELVEDLKVIRAQLGPEKPFILWIGVSIPRVEDRSAEEIRCACYLALMQGATGLIFHMGHKGVGPEYTRIWSVFPGLSREVEPLFAILTTAQEAALFEVGIERPEIEYCVRQCDGKWYVVAVNTAAEPVEASISIGGTAPAFQRVSLPFEDRQIEVADRAFRDSFTAYEPHLYELI